MSPPIDLTGEDEHDDDRRPAGDKAKRGRPSNQRVAGELKTLINEQLTELAEWVNSKDPELGEILREDAPKIAKVLATRAGKHARLGRALRVVFAPDGPLGILRAFGRTARAVGSRIGARRQPRLAVDDEGFLIDDSGQRILEDGQPIRADA